jgi:AP-2 complex subunit alpha
VAKVQRSWRLETIKKHQATVLVSLKDADMCCVSVGSLVCDTDTERIVDELVAHLALADAAIREEMVLKIAILAEICY